MTYKIGRKMKYRRISFVKLQEEQKDVLNENGSMKHTLRMNDFLGLESYEYLCKYLKKLSMLVQWRIYGRSRKDGGEIKSH